MLVKYIKSSFFPNAAAVRYFISLDLEKMKTNLASECVLQTCFPSMCSSGCFILLFSLWFILIKLHSLSDSLPVKYLREIIWWWSWDHLGGRGIRGSWALEQRWLRYVLWFGLFQDLFAYSIKVFQTNSTGSLEGQKYIKKLLYICIVLCWVEGPCYCTNDLPKSVKVRWCFWNHL